MTVIVYLNYNRGCVSPAQKNSHTVVERLGNNETEMALAVVMSQAAGFTAKFEILATGLERVETLNT